MKAAVITRPGGPDVLEVRDVAQPEVISDQVLIRVRASGLNRADLLQREGRYPPPFGAPADIPGIELAGEVAAIGPLVQMWRPGQRVFGLIGGGAHAEFALAQERTLAEVPSNLGWTEAGSIPEAFMTAHDALLQAGFRPCETVLIHAVGSGVGIAVVQLVHALGGVPYGTSRTAGKLDRAREFGMAEGVVTGSSLEVIPEAVKRWTEGRGADIVLDLAGGPYVDASLRSLAPKGRLMCIGTVAGGRAELDLRLVLSRRVTVRGTVFRSRPLEEKIAATRAFAQEVVPLFALGALRAVIDSDFPLERVREAHERLQSNATFGKVVLRIGG